MVNENDIDVKIDYDPIKTLGTMNFGIGITYTQIFCETAHFLSISNGTKPYLEYPKMYLNGNKPKCNETRHCLQCYNINKNNHKNNNSTTIFSLCQTKRRQIANKLFDMSQQRRCNTESLVYSFVFIFTITTRSSANINTKFSSYQHAVNRC